MTTDGEHPVCGVVTQEDVLTMDDNSSARSSFQGRKKYWILTNGKMQEGTFYLDDDFSEFDEDNANCRRLDQHPELKIRSLQKELWLLRERVDYISALEEEKEQKLRDELVKNYILTNEKAAWAEDRREMNCEIKRLKEEIDTLGQTNARYRDEIYRVWKDVEAREGMATTQLEDEDPCTTGGQQEAEIPVAKEPDFQEPLAKEPVFQKPLAKEPKPDATVAQKAKKKVELELKNATPKKSSLKKATKKAGEEEDERPDQLFVNLSAEKATSKAKKSLTKEPDPFSKREERQERLYLEQTSYEGKLQLKDRLKEFRNSILGEKGQSGIFENIQRCIFTGNKPPMQQKSYSNAYIPQRSDGPSATIDSDVEKKESTVAREPEYLPDHEYSPGRDFGDDHKPDPPSGATSQDDLPSDLEEEEIESDEPKTTVDSDVEKKEPTPALGPDCFSSTVNSDAEKKELTLALGPNRSFSTDDLPGLDNGEDPSPKPPSYPTDQDDPPPQGNPRGRPPREPPPPLPRKPPPSISQAG